MQDVCVPNAQIWSEMFQLDLNTTVDIKEKLDQLTHNWNGQSPILAYIFKGISDCVMDQDLLRM